MIITGREGLGIIDGDPQPHGVDVRVKNVYYLIDKDINAPVTDEDYKELKFLIDEDTNKKFWFLQPKKAYLFQLEKVNLSKENIGRPVVGYLLPKSRFCRCGISINSALWESGYIGAGRALVINHSDIQQKIYKDMFFGQMIFLDVKNGQVVYNGTHQGEGLTESLK